jgi:hypothetical protein
MAVVVAEHERADAQRRGDRGRVRERDGRRQWMIDEMVGYEQCRVAERFRLAREFGELLSVLDAGSRAREGEAEATIVRRGAAT